jgi:ubiquinone biosynthesis protein UbiJ
MIKPVITRLLNHLVNQNSWARAELQPFGGKSVRLNIMPASAIVSILENGGLALAGDVAEPEAIISIPLTVALRILTNDETANTLVEIDGDTELATALAKVLRGMRWEYEEDLSRVIGDAPAYQAAEFCRKALAEMRRQSMNVAEMFSEYWQEEQPLIAKKRHVVEFVKQVDELRDDSERLAKRIEKLEAKLVTDAAQTQSVVENPAN